MSATTISAVNWMQPQIKVVHIGTFTFVESAGSTPDTAVFSINSDNSVYESTGPGINIALGGNVNQISAGLDSSGKPEVYGITANGTPFVNDGSGWNSLGGTVTQLSASVNGTVYGLFSDKSVWVNHGSGWQPLYGNATQISAGVDTAGKPEVYATEYSTMEAYVNDGNRWVDLQGGAFKQLSGSINGEVYGINQSNMVEVYAGGAWQSLGGKQATQISSGIDSTGKPEVFETGFPATEIYVYDGNGWVDLKSTACEIAGPSVGVGVTGTPLATVTMNGQTTVNGTSGFYALSTSLDAVQTKYETLGGATGSLGLENGPETPVGFGYFQNYQNGAIYWSSSTGAHYIYGATYTKWLANGGPSGQSLGQTQGFPTVDTQAYANGTISSFQTVKVISSPYGVREVAANPSSLSFNSYNLNAGDGVNGVAQLTVNSNGSYSISYNFINNSDGFIGIGADSEYDVKFTLVSPTGYVFQFYHNYDISDQDHGTLTGTDANLAIKWRDLQGCVAQASASTGTGQGALDLNGLTGEATPSAMFSSNIIGQSASLYGSLVQPLQELFFIANGQNGDSSYFLG